MKWLTFTLLGLVGLIAIAAVLLYQGDLPASVVDARYANDASRFLETPTGARIHYRD